MKKNIGFDFIFASISAAALVLFMSCGHQSRRGDDGLFADMDQDHSAETSEVSVPTEEQSASREISSDLTQSADAEASLPIEDKSANAATPGTPMDPTQLTDNTAAKQADELTALAGGSENHVAQMDAAPPVAESLPPMEETVPEAKPEVKAPETALLPPADNKASDILAQITVPAAESVPSNIETEVAAAPAAETAKPAAAKSSARKSSKGSSALPKDSVWKKGHTMNRFYFLRSGDTAEKMAEMIYGDKAKAEELSTWNPGTWSTGKVIVYESAVTPNDTEMKSFYEERELPSEAYTVKKGEKLAAIAQAIYGDKASVAEIAAFNGLGKNAKVAEGTVINVFPASIPALEKEETVAVTSSEKVEAPAESNEQKIAAIVASKEPVKEEPAVKAAAEPEAQMVKRERPRQAALANAEVGGFFEEHIAAMLGGALILLASFFAFRYFRRTRELQD